MNLFKASTQWATRPPDERFSSLQEMRGACFAYYKSAVESVTSFATLRVEAEDGEVKIVGPEQRARLTNWAFGQICTKVGAPAGYLRSLSATLACQNLNHGFKSSAVDLAKEGNAHLLFHNNGGLLLRAAVSDKYSRIWNYEVVDRLLDLPDGWRTPPARPAFGNQVGTRPATEDDVLGASDFGLSISVGDEIAPAGLYASDHDCFVFMVNESSRVKDGSAEGLARGFFLENSEVGASSLRVTTFLYRHVCGNHIVWDTKDVRDVAIRHVGRARENAFSEFAVQLREYSDASVSDDEAKIKLAQSFKIAAKKEDVIDALFKIKAIGLSKRLLSDAYDTTEELSEIDGDPRTAWGMAQGVTRISQESEFADERRTLDKAAGKIAQIAF